MRTTTNLLLVNMACADILVATLYMTNQPRYLFLYEKWFGGVIGSIFCKTVFVSQYLPACGTVWSTAIISIDRFLAIISPLKKTFISICCKIVICSIWLLLLLVLGHTFLYPRVIFSEMAWLCIKRASFSYFIYFQYASLAFLLPLPLVIIISSYSVICYRLHNWKIPGLNTNQQVQRVAATTRKVSRLTIAIISSYSLCWLPFFIFVVMMEGNPYKMRSVYLSATWLSTLYSALNPVICISMNNNFRHRLPLFFKPIRVTHRDCCKENQPRKFKTLDTRL